MTGTHETARPASTTTEAAASGPLHRVGFDRAKYIELQSQHIQERRRQIGGKLYLEMGGKLFDLSLIHISEPTRRTERSRMPSSA